MDIRRYNYYTISNWIIDLSRDIFWGDTIRELKLLKKLKFPAERRGKGKLGQDGEIDIFSIR